MAGPPWPRLPCGPRSPTCKCPLPAGLAPANKCGPLTQAGSAGVFGGGGGAAPRPTVRPRCLSRAGPLAAPLHALPPVSPLEQRLQAAAGHHGEQARQRERRAHPLQHAAQGAGEWPGRGSGGPPEPPRGGVPGPGVGRERVQASAGGGKAPPGRGFGPSPRGGESALPHPRETAGWSGASAGAGLPQAGPRPSALRAALPPSRRGTG